MGAMFALLSALCWALGNIYVRRGQASDPTDGGLYITVIANAVLFTVLSGSLALFGGVPPLLWQGLALFVVAGILTTFLGRMFNFVSIRRLGPSRAAAFKVIAPVFTLLAAFFLLAERLQWGQLAGFVIVTAGLWAITLDVNHEGRNTPAVKRSARLLSDRKGAIELGVIFGLLAAASFGTGHTFRKMALSFIPSPYLGATIGSWVAVLSLLTTGTAQGKLPDLFCLQFYKGKRDFVIAGIVTSFAQLFLFLAFTVSAVSTASVLAATEPMMTLILSPLLMRQAPEKITPLLIAGCLFVVTGTILIIIT